MNIHITCPSSFHNVDLVSSVNVFHVSLLVHVSPCRKAASENGFVGKSYELEQATSFLHENGMFQKNKSLFLENPSRRSNLSCFMCFINALVCFRNSVTL